MIQLLCAYCQTNYEARRKDQTYCGAPECKRARHNARMRAWNAKNPGYYTDRPSRARYKKERAAGVRPHHRETNPEAARAADQRRRARKAGADCENFQSKEVFQRDGWICGICLEPVDPELRYPDSKSASLDHTIPLILGGGHTRANTRCSHLNCNVRRGAAMEPSTE